MRAVSHVLAVAGLVLLASSCNLNPRNFGLPRTAVSVVSPDGQYIAEVRNHRHRRALSEPLGGAEGEPRGNFDGWARTPTGVRPWCGRRTAEQWRFWSRCTPRYRRRVVGAGALRDVADRAQRRLSASPHGNGACTVVGWPPGVVPRLPAQYHAPRLRVRRVRVLRHPNGDVRPGV